MMIPVEAKDFFDVIRETRELCEMILKVKKILDHENRFESLEDVAKARMQQIVALEALR